MQHEDLPQPGLAPSLLSDHMDALWPVLGSDDRRALRLCCTAMRDSVDAHASSLEGQGWSPVLSPATVARLAGVRSLALCSMVCLYGMLVAPPQPGVFFPRLQSLRLRLLEVRAPAGAAATRMACLAWGGPHGVICHHH
jgi:hypothetical protein